MNNLQPDLHSAPSLPCPWKEWNEDESRECHFCLLRMIPWTEIWIMAILCLDVFCIYQGGDRSRNRSSQSGCEMENTFTVRADECLSSNDPNVIVTPLKAMVSGQLQRPLVLNKKKHICKTGYLFIFILEKGKNIVVSCRTYPFRHVRCFRQIHVGRCMCVCVCMACVGDVCMWKANQHYHTSERRLILPFSRGSTPEVPHWSLQVTHNQQRIEKCSI